MNVYDIEKLEAAKKDFIVVIGRYDFVHFWQGWMVKWQTPHRPENVFRRVNVKTVFYCVIAGNVIQTLWSGGKLKIIILS